MRANNNRFLFLLLGFLGMAIFVSIFIASKVIITEYESDMYKSFEKLKQKEIENRKVIAKDRVHSIIQYLTVEQNSIATMIRKKTKSSIETVDALLNSYYNYNKDHMTIEQMKIALMKILSTMRWDDGRGYYFILDNNGVELMNPLNIELEGKDLTNLQDAHGTFLVKDILNLANTKGEGHIEYYWTKQNNIDKLEDKKISYIKKFTPFNWIIGSGEYRYDYTKEVQQKTLQKLNKIRFNNDENNYIFVYDLHDIHGGDEFATMLINPNRPDLIGNKISSKIQDVNGKMYRQKMLEHISKEKHALVEYAYVAPKSKEIERKISYFTLFEDWNWIIASGIFLGDIENEYQKNIKALDNAILNKIYGLELLFLFLSFLLIFFAYFVLRIQKQKHEILSNKIEEDNKALKIQIEEEFRQKIALSKMAEIGEMIGVITHQLKQPLNSISLLSQDIKEMEKFQELTSENITQVTNDIEGQLKFMIQTIDNFRDFFKPEKEKKLFSTNKALCDILNIFSIQKRTLNIEIDVINNANDDIVYGVENELKQVFLNILNNARDVFVEKQLQENHLSITFTNSEHTLTITIVDNAGGIDEHLLPDLIFKSYVSTKGEKGTGIGLSMSQMIINQRFLGTLSAVNVDNGAMFTITLPQSNSKDKQ